MIHLLELDLDRPSAELGAVDGEAWVLVRKGPRILGELRIKDFTASRRTLRQMAVETFAVALALGGAEPDAPTPTDRTISIVVCTRSRATLLSGCLGRLVALAPAADQILVVDNAPEDGSTKAVAAGFGVDYLVEPEPGLDRARNAGWRAADGDLVAYVDDDARADSQFAGAVGRGFLDDSVGAVTGLVRPHELLSYPQIAFERLEGGMGKGFDRLVFSAGKVGLRSYALGVGTNMAFRRTVLADLGGFDPSLDVGTPTRGGGDLDMLWRVLDAGHNVVYQPDALVRHIHRRTRTGLVNQFRDNGTAYRAFLQRRVQADPELRSTVKREIRRWHLHRHLIAPLRCIRRGELLHLQMLLAEAEGSRRGVSGLAESDAAG